MADIPPLDLHPLVRQLKSLLYGVADETLAAPTPCPQWSVGDLLDHLMVLTVAFTRGARKTARVPATGVPASGVPAATPSDATPQASGPPAPAGVNLHPQWRSRLPPQLDEMADAWAEPDAWAGTTQVGGITLPAEQHGLFGTNELVMHGWDLARATGQDFAVDPRLLEILIGFLSTLPPAGIPGLFGPVVPVDDEEALLVRVVGLGGRDPSWRR